MVTGSLPQPHVIRVSVCRKDISLFIKNPKTMAHNIVPQHKPHDQLRTEPPIQEAHNDKYVSAFTTAENLVDFTFVNPILGKSSDHFKVGVDELTVNMSAISMLEINKRPDVVFRILRRGVDTGIDGNWEMHDSAIVGNEGSLRAGFEFKVDRAYTTLQGFIRKCEEISNAVNSYITTTDLTQNNGFDYEKDFSTGNYSDDLFLQIGINSSGNLAFTTNAAFWCNFVIEVPMEKYRSALFGDNRRYISMHPLTGEIRDPYTIVQAGLTTLPFDPVVDDAAGAAWDNISHQNETDEYNHVYRSNVSLFHTLDRRVTVEVGCSLPLKNSPFVDHKKETPDYVLGRYMFQRPYSVSHETKNQNLVITDSGVGSVQLQGPKDRIVYHHLKPQQKIHTLRLKLWLRVRSYDTDSGKWGMKTIACPVTSTDFWHIRLHFKQKN